MTVDRRTVLHAAGALTVLLSPPARALPAARGTVVLTVVDQARPPKPGVATQFDMPMLEQLPQTSFTTRTPWFAQPRKFTGPLMRDVLVAAGAHGGTLRLVALNDYWVEIPFDDAMQFDVLVARLLDDKPMAVRDKGPLFVIYPFDEHPELRSPIYYNRSAWQLRTIEVR